MKLFARTNTFLLGATMFLVLACSKPDTQPTPNPTPPTGGGTGSGSGSGGGTNPPSTFTVDGKWECLVDGAPYSGTMDTSYVVINQNGASFIDTTVWCTGTSLDKKANIHFRISINRRLSSPVITTAIDAHFVFDTTGNSYLQAAYGSSSRMTITVDTLQDGKLKARFSGTADKRQMVGGNSSTHTITAGKFSCELGKGNGEPKFFSYTSNNKKAGFFRRARLLTNQMILEGMTFGYETAEYFRLVIQTGGTVKPGIYKSKLGEAGLRFFIPSINTDYVNDSIGDLTVIITSVSGNVVKGSFSGVAGNGWPLSGGTFSCRLKDYQPQPEADTRWRFSFDNEILGYNCYAGNITSAVKSQVGNRYTVTINGESDHNTSVYKLVLSSNTPIATGIYGSNFMVWPNQIDSAYFRSNEPLWNGNPTYLFSETYSDTWCKIDTVDATKIVGTMYGKLRVFYSSAGFGATNVKFGTFRAKF